MNHPSAKATATNPTNTDDRLNCQGDFMRRVQTNDAPASKATINRKMPVSHANARKSNSVTWRVNDQRPISGLLRRRKTNGQPCS